MKIRLNNLANLTFEELVNTVQQIPAMTTSLDLSVNGLHKIKVESLVFVLKLLPPDLKSLDLGYNGLKRSAGAFIEILKNIPSSITQLSLKGNNRSSMSFMEAAILLSFTNNSSRLLDQDNDGPAQPLSAIDWMKVIIALPKNLTDLDLSSNDLNMLSVHELIKIFEKLPTNLISINLAANGLNKLSKTDLNKVLTAFPINIKSIILEDDKSINLDEFRNKQTQLKNLDAQLLILKRKAGELQNHKEAYQAAEGLHKTLMKLKNEYSNDTIEPTTFKSKTINAITAARTPLETHRGCKEILGNLALCILGLGVFYLAACAYNGRFFKFKTDSSIILDDLQEVIEPVSLTI